jgi:hypothetical protein
MPDSPQELQADPETPFHVMWVETKLGTRYELPDMLEKHVDEAVRALHGGLPNITMTNISECCLLMPRRIIKKAGVGERCFWEAPE